RQDIRKIVEIQFRIIKTRLGESGINVEITDKALDYLGEAGYDPEFGARPLKRVIQREILNELSKQILSGAIAKDSVVGIDLNDKGSIEFLNLDEVGAA
ncbi:MAG: type VI secretion system ATPase TssH, partial [Cyclobacteriaceae bacterium]|nr:type VI secretion system ATPase TssH [Cyclobacteriaceae bacterium]